MNIQNLVNKTLGDQGFDCLEVVFETDSGLGSEAKASGKLANILEETEDLR